MPVEQSIPTKILKRLFGETTSIPFWVLSWPVWPVRLRTAVLVLFGAAIPGDVRIFPGTMIVGRRLEIGSGSFVNSGCHLDATDRLVIGRDVHLSPKVVVLTITHELSGPGRRAGRVSTAPVIIEDGAWIGAGATILPGVTIGHGVVVAAGSVVTSDCEPDQLYAGVPAHSVKLLPLSPVPVADAGATAS